VEVDDGVVQMEEIDSRRDDQSEFEAD